MSMQAYICIPWNMLSSKKTDIFLQSHKKFHLWIDILWIIFCLGMFLTNYLQECEHGFLKSPYLCVQDIAWLKLGPYFFSGAGQWHQGNCSHWPEVCVFITSSCFQSVLQVGRCRPWRKYIHVWNPPHSAPKESHPAGISRGSSTPCTGYYLKLQM